MSVKTRGRHHPQLHELSAQHPAMHAQAVLSSGRRDVLRPRGTLPPTVSLTLTEQERACVHRYVELLAEGLGGRLIRVELIGSAARGELWPAHHPILSDVDLLVVTSEAVAATEADALVNATYPLFLECGRHISPQFLDQARIDSPTTKRDADFLATVAPHAVALWPEPEAARQ